MIYSCNSKIVLQSICCNPNKIEPNIQTSEQNFYSNKINNFDVGNNIRHCLCLKPEAWSTYQTKLEDIRLNGNTSFFFLHLRSDII